MSGLLRVLSAAIFLIVAVRPATAAPGQMGLFPAKTAKLRSVLPPPSMRVASCDGLAPTKLVVSVGEQPLTKRRDLSRAMLRALSEQARHRPSHAVLGFYAGSVGFVPPEFEVLTDASAGVSHGVPCPHVEVRSKLVAIDRQVAIASDLHSSPYLLRAATAHYERHAEIASRALHRFAGELPATLGPEIDRYVRIRPFLPEAGNDQLRSFIEGILTRSVTEFTARLAMLQEAADTPDEARSLAPCDDT